VKSKKFIKKNGAQEQRVKKQKNFTGFEIVVLLVVIILEVKLKLKVKIHRFFQI